jgi:paired amphipathic helix protein Sin3a
VAVPPANSPVVVQSPPQAAPTAQAIHIQQPTGAAAQAGAAPGYRQGKLENALEFLDQVKAQFAKQPRVYNQFLDIMKDFKTQSIDTPGVIARVSELFKGHKHLILGFNTFLPPGWKIEEPIPPPAPPPVQQRRAPPAQPTQPAQRKQPEFDHARNYVKKIKQRFALQPHIYKAFLEILHTYHKEQHTIKDVYDQVANLFANHPDLLDEFTQFLPDPIPPSQQQQQAAAPRAAKPPRGGPRKTPGRLPAPIPAEVTTRAKRRAEPAKVEEKQTLINGTPEELAFFSKVKTKLNTKRYSEFLKCLNLYNQEIISRMELALLVKDLLGKYADLFDKFKAMLGVTEIEQDISDAERKLPKPSSAWSEIDFTTCKRLGPSYRALPKNFAVPVCSGRTPLCDEVLNDTWVSVPMGSEDFTFKSSRKNQYEEILFKCEDDRYELDLVIELNASTMRMFEPVAKRITELPEEEKQHFRLEKLEQQLEVIHLKSIERIYGEQGPDVIDGLYANPVVAVPIVLKRLKQKDQEWRRARREWNKIWREVNEKNYYKSLDHQSFSFKQSEKKNLSPKVLLAEIKQRHAERLKSASSQTQRDLISSFTDKTVFDDVSEYILYTADKIVGKPELEKLRAFLQRFLTHFFDKEFMGDAPAESPAADAAAADAPAAASSAPAPMEGVTSTSPPATPAAAAPVAAPAVKEEANVTPAESKVKPVVTVAADSASGEKKEKEAPQAEDVSGKRRRLFFGNTTFYVFFRLYQTLYERVAKAQELTRNPPKDGYAPPASKEKNPPPEKKEKYQFFQKLLYAMINGQIDQTKFEDEIRDLYGIMAYPLYTLDKLLFQTVKQLQALLGDDFCQKQLALYKYEDARDASFEQSYHANASTAEVLGEGERCFRFEWESAPRGALMLITLMASQQTPRFIELNFAKEKWQQYLENYTQGDSDLELRKARVCLIRNQRKNLGRKVMDRLEMVNGLECKICMNTYKMFYVEDTEDYMFRRRPQSATKAQRYDAQRKRETDRFHTLMEAKVSAAAK